MVVFAACETTHVSAPLPLKVIGNWLVVSEQRKSNSNVIVENDNGLLNYLEQKPGVARKNRVT